MSADYHSSEEVEPADNDTRRPSRGVYWLPNLFTTGTLFGGFYAIVAAIDGNFSNAGIAIFVAMVADGLDGRVRHQRLPDGGLVAVGHEQDALEGDRLAGLDVEQLDLELGADLDAVLLAAGLDDCVHGSSGCSGRGTAAGPFGGQGKTPRSRRDEGGVYAAAPDRSNEGRRAGC